MFLKSDIRAALQEKLDECKNSLANGCASSYSDYQHMVGYITGLEDAVELTIAVVTRNIEIDDED